MTALRLSDEALQSALVRRARADAAWPRFKVVDSFARQIVSAFADEASALRLAARLSDQDRRPYMVVEEPADYVRTRRA